jgi:hypothetical protein
MSERSIKEKLPIFLRKKMIISHYKSLIALLTLTFLFSCKQENKPLSDIPPNEVVPTPSQVAYQQMELIGFIHLPSTPSPTRNGGMEMNRPNSLIPLSWMLSNG